MTDKEFKQLNREQLIDIIYQLQLQVDELTEKNHSLEKALVDKRIRINNAGSIAEAALEINECFRNAQVAAEQYLSEIKAMREETEAECERTFAEARAKAEAECERTLAAAQAKAEEIIANAQKNQVDYDIAVEAILNEYVQNHSNNG